MIEACVFDVGNTLTNAAMLMEASLQNLALWLKEKGILKEERSFIDAYKKFNKALHRPHWSHAFGEVELFTRTLRVLGIKEVQPKEVLKKYREFFEARTNPDPDVIEAFEFLKGRGIRVALISNDRSAYIEMFTRRTKIRRLLDAVVVSEEVGVEKPHPIMFEEVKKMLEVEFSEMVIFGDSEVSDGGGQKLGMKFVLVKAYRDPNWSWCEGKAVEPDYTIWKVTRRGVEECLRALETTIVP